MADPGIPEPQGLRGAPPPQGCLWRAAWGLQSRVHAGRARKEPASGGERGLSLRRGCGLPEGDPSSPAGHSSRFLPVRWLTSWSQPSRDRQFCLLRAPAPPLKPPPAPPPARRLSWKATPCSSGCGRRPPGLKPVCACI